MWLYQIPCVFNNQAKSLGMNIKVICWMKIKQHHQVWSILLHIDKYYNNVIQSNNIISLNCFKYLLTAIWIEIGLPSENKKIASICGSDMFYPNLTYESTGTTLTLELRTDNQGSKRGFVATVQGIILKNISLVIDMHRIMLHTLFVLLNHNCNWLHVRIAFIVRNEKKS